MAHRTVMNTALKYVGTGAVFALQCRRRWKNVLNVTLKTGGWTAEEDAMLVEGHRHHGNRWTEIAEMIGGRCSPPALHCWFWPACF